MRLCWAQGWSILHLASYIAVPIAVLTGQSRDDILAIPPVLVPRRRDAGVTLPAVHSAAPREADREVLTRRTDAGFGTTDRGLFSFEHWRPPT